MASEVTYLFGAGASRYAVPIVSEMSESLKKFSAWFNSQLNIALPSDQYFKGYNGKLSKGQFQKHFSESLEGLIAGLKDYKSVDEYAMYLLSKNPMGFHNLKATLACFFIFEQMKNQINLRYRSFFSSIINPRLKVNNLPSNLKILSWNYDMQFEKAYHPFSPFPELSGILSALNAFPPSINFLESKNSFSIFKLNGTAAIHEVETGQIQNIIPHTNMELNHILIETVINSYGGFLTHPHQWKPIINFAFEESDISKRIIYNAKEATKNTEVLVIIGYSFPFVNRKIDREIICNMKNLKKVYMQAPDTDVTHYTNEFRVQILDLDNIIPISKLDLFYLPSELDLIYN